jgi:hypothetical protein
MGNWEDEMVVIEDVEGCRCGCTLPVLVNIKNAIERPARAQLNDTHGY